MLTRDAFIARLSACGLPPEIWKPGELEQFCEEYEKGDLLFDFEQKVRTIHVLIPHIYADFRDTRGKKRRYKLFEHRIVGGEKKLRYKHEGSASEKLHFVHYETWREGLIRQLDEELKLRHRKSNRLIKLSDLPDLFLFPKSPRLDDDRESSKYPASIRTERYLYPVSFTLPAAFRRREGYVEMEKDGEAIKSQFLWRPVRFRGRIEDAAPLRSLLFA